MAVITVSDRSSRGERIDAAGPLVTSMLFQAAAGIRNHSLIVNLPGSPRAARENLEAVLPTLACGLEMLRGGPADCANESIRQ